MKNEWLITFRSVTFAQRGEQLLRSNHIACRMQRTPKHLTERGCGYCLRLESVDVPEAMAIFHREKLPYEKIYAIKEDGTTKEQRL